MHTNQARNKIFKSWSGISEVSIIKEVATKGEHIDLCLEYWAGKRKLPLSEYQHYFHDVVCAYVQRLLSERLVCKAENVLRNVERDVMCCFYQYACECNDAELSEFVLDHLRSKDAALYEQQQPALEYYWSLLQQLRECEALLKRHKQELPRLQLEALMKLPEQRLQQLLVELYFEQGNESLLPQLQKQLVWQQLVASQQLQQLRSWCRCQQQGAAEQPLERAYAEWSIEPAMYEHALDNLVEPCEPLRYYFAQAGYFFAAEAQQPSQVLRRLCSTQSLARHAALIEQLPLAAQLYREGYYTLLLLPCVPSESLQRLQGEQQQPLLTLILQLKCSQLAKREDFEQSSRAVQSYLMATHAGAASLQEQPLLTFYDLLTHAPSVSSLGDYLNSSNLCRLNYLHSLSARLEQQPSALPTPQQLFQRFKRLQLSAGELQSFSQPRLSQRYARQFQLNYTHYLKQLRSAYAVYYLLQEQLQLYGQITRTQLYQAAETATQLALQHAHDSALVTHCVACCEMLDFDTQALRSYLQLNNQLGSVSVSYQQQLQLWDASLLQQLLAKPQQFPLAAYQALQRLLATQSAGNYATACLQHFAAADNWWALLLLFQYFELPLSALKVLLPHFSSTQLGMQLLRALNHQTQPQRNKRAKATSNQNNNNSSSSQEQMTLSSHSSLLELPLQKSATSICNMLSVAATPQDLFANIICSSNQLQEQRIDNFQHYLELLQGSTLHCSSVQLLQHCVRQQQPVLAVLAACLNPAQSHWCWLSWLALTTGQWAQLLQAREQPLLELVWLLIRGAVSTNQLSALLHSFCIFQAHSKFLHLCRFLQLTAQQQQFDDAAILELRQFLCSWSQDAVQLPLCAPMPRQALMQRCLRLLLLQLQSNFPDIKQQQRYLEAICRSDVGDVTELLDFCLLQRIFSVAAPWLRQLCLDYEQLLQPTGNEYRRLINALLAAQAFDAALQLSTLLQLPLADIVYAKWLAQLQSDELRPQAAYEAEIAQHALPPVLLVNFLLQAAASASLLRRFELLQRALDVIKQHHLFPNECFDRDQIEYDMVCCYLQLEQQPALPIYHSEYFEQIMQQERCVLYKSFAELKELAGIDDLSIASKCKLDASMEQRLVALIHQLLDEGDIVEALRLQELFEQRPTDLRFLVYAMALAEGVTSTEKLSSKERQLLTDIEPSSFPKFNRLSLNQSPLTRCGSDLSGSCSTLEFELIPSKQKQQTLDTLLGIGCKLKHGVELGRRIVLAYRAAMYLDKEYLDVLRTKDVSVLLQSAAAEECLQRLLVVSDIHISTRMTHKEIASSLALELTTCIVRPRFYIFHANQQPRSAPSNATLWGHNIDKDFHLFLELTPQATLLGNCLLDYCDALKSYRRYQDGKHYVPSVAFEQLCSIISLYGLPQGSSTPSSPATPPQVLSHKKQNQIYVELLIKAHLCFVHECSMEGIASVLERAKQLNSQLTQAKSWSLIVRLLMGIARYREMFYCFDALIEHEQFESLLGQFDEEQKSGLRQAILSYLREYSPPQSKELLRLAAHHFLMYKELAELWSTEAQSLLEQVRLTHINLAATNQLNCSTELQSLLQQSLENFTHATENFLLDNKLLLAQQSVSRAELVAMQLDLCSKHNTPTCLNVIGVQNREQFRELVNTHLSVPQSLILSRALGYDINWSDALLSQFVLQQKRSYLQQYRYHQRINDNVIEQIVKGYLLHLQQHAPSVRQEESLAELLQLTKSVTLKYKLASILGLKSIVVALLNGHTVHYLRDTNFGRNELTNM
ncbi:CG13531 [Drosophila busckii]|uniref:CG13531 n=1 Tax=Drosophila busckii TaxID=30019 RepID=A0A0M4EIF9_DROBS|nr:spatacsin [Drosophila busckii]ALC42547.1 CG13531 [Drosophila busckii]